MLQTITYEYHCPAECKRPERPVNIVLLTDLHNCTCGRDNEKLLNRIEEAEPDFIVCAGDIVTVNRGRCRMDHSLPFLERIAEMAPVYFSLGNHERRLIERTEKYGTEYWRILHSALVNAGIHLCDEETFEFEMAGLPIRVRGSNLPLIYYKRIHRPDDVPAYLKEQNYFCRQPKTKQMNASAPEGRPLNILAAHHPDYFRDYVREGADLVLSGHVHGGVVRLPFLGGVLGATYKLFPEYTKGRYTFENGCMILSGGLGTHSIPLRINNPPEVSVVRIVP